MVVRTAHAICIIAVAQAAIGCSIDDVTLPETKLPKQPWSTNVQCQPLTDAEQQACLKEAKEARTVCYKVQRNEAICKDQQDFVKRLYKARDGK